MWKSGNRIYDLRIQRLKHFSVYLNQINILSILQINLIMIIEQSLLKVEIIFNGWSLYLCLNITVRE